MAPQLRLAVTSAGYPRTDKRWIEIKAPTSGKGIAIVGHSGSNSTDRQIIPFDQLWEHACNGRSSPIYGDGEPRPKGD